MPLNKPPPAQEPSPYLPTQLPPLVCNQFAGVRTDAGRTGVPDENVYWMDGVMPYAPKRARSMYGVGSVLFTASGGLTIVFYRFVTLNNLPLCIIVMSDGSILQVRTDTAAVTTIAAANTILSPSQLVCDINQWGNLYVLIVARQTNGYWVWNGSALFTAGTLAPVITITNAGAGYSTPPAVIISGGHGSGATGVASVANGVVTGATLTNPGSGFLAGDAVSIAFVGGTSAGSGGSVTAIMAHNTGGNSGSIVVLPLSVVPEGYAVASLTIANAGTGYSPNAAAVVSGGNVIGGDEAIITLSIVSGTIASYNLISGGGYRTATPVPIVTITDPGGYYVSSVSVVAVGSGYSPNTSITGTGGGTIIAAQATYTPVLNNGTISAVDITSPGSYGSNVAPTLTVTDTSVIATGSISLMPFAISGNTVETYQGYVWIGNGAIIFNSAPGSVSDFTGSNGGGNQTSNDSFLKVGYTKFIQMNGFLWLVSDCAVSYISGVQTGFVPGSTINIQTTYTKQNADPEVGSTWPNTVLPWGNGLMLSNLWGEFVGYGAEMKKVSEPMDGVYPSPTINLGITPSAAKAIVFNRKIVCLLIPITDPVTGVNANKLLIWDGKRWWAALQDVNLTYIQTQELNSLLTAWGTDGTHIYPLFQQPSTAFVKTIQTKLWDQPGGIMLAKAVNRFWGVMKYNTVTSPNLTLTIDNEGGEGSRRPPIRSPAPARRAILSSRRRRRAKLACTRG